MDGRVVASSAANFPRFNRSFNPRRTRPELSAVVNNNINEYTMAVWTRTRVPFLCHQVTRTLHTSPQTPSSTRDALALIRSQPNRYVIASIAGRKYLLAPKDLLTVPRLNDVRVGDVLSLSQIHEVGSREYTLRGSPDIPTGHVSVEATVVEHTKGAMEHIFKKKRRKGYERTIPHKQTYTRVRIGPICVRPDGDADTM
ncbi:ribosomal protein L21-like protein [Russula earlei]|uniref:Ribosomal protein L21-like protein n=1 Tax=Russula earlei TaxID=71964 RepID=A0ACC0U9G5_9AGAM|nr:ribosomal protein L21-like protein [Russula earlei]